MFSKSDEDHSTSDHTKLKGERAARTLVTADTDDTHLRRLRLVATHDTTRDGAGGGAEAAI